MKADNDNEKDGEMLFGTPAIAAFLGLTQQQVYRLVYAGRMPIFKVGRAVCARRSSLLKWLASLERAA